jgi:hypothetical protein
VSPQSDRVVGHNHTTLEKQFLEVARAQRSGKIDQREAQMLIAAWKLCRGVVRVPSFLRFAIFHDQFMDQTTE